MGLPRPTPRRPLASSHHPAIPVLPCGSITAVPQLPHTRRVRPIEAGPGRPYRNIFRSNTPRRRHLANAIVPGIASKPRRRPSPRTPPPPPHPTQPRRRRSRRRLQPHLAAAVVASTQTPAPLSSPAPIAAAPSSLAPTPPPSPPTRRCRVLQPGAQAFAPQPGVAVAPNQPPSSPPARRRHRLLQPGAAIISSKPLPLSGGGHAAPSPPPRHLTTEMAVYQYLLSNMAAAKILWQEQHRSSS
uniref:Uncharacterized protein n=1 Tax=Setaria viridis TaxID=4556 RepID=A0A4U6WCB2_SETVI|nr:hypothetical protein SEVIR_1G173000v2 [Setaria viridis]